MKPTENFCRYEKRTRYALYLRIFSSYKPPYEKWSKPLEV
jgi:hypothetical protein